MSEIILKNWLNHTNLEECNCPCHIIRGFMHIVACCNQCPHCNKRFKTSYDNKLFKEHVEQCKNSLTSI